MFGLGEGRVEVRVRDFLSANHLAASIIAGVAIATEEILSNIMVAIADLSKGKALVAKHLFRLATSALIYYGLRNVNPAAAFGGSVALLGLSVADLISYVLGYTPAQVALSLSAWVKGARAVE